MKGRKLETPLYRWIGKEHAVKPLPGVETRIAPCDLPLHDILQHKHWRQGFCRHMQVCWNLQRAVCMHSIAIELDPDFFGEIAKLVPGPAMTST